MEQQLTLVRPCRPLTKPPRYAKRLPVLAGLGVAAAAFWHGQEAFTGGALANHRPAGGVIVVDELPSGVACRAYGDKDPERPEWLVQDYWRGERTFRPDKEMQSDEHRQWWHFNAEGKMLGSLAQLVQKRLRGIDNPLYYPGSDLGSYVIITNCEKVRVPGKQYQYKLYLRNTVNLPGHCKVERFRDLQARFPERILMRAVWGAMPKTPQCRRIFKDRLKLFTGPNHCYYDKDPIDFPMHRVKDCTWETNLRFRDRLSKWIKGRGAKVVKDNKEREAKEQEKSLKSFKDFLSKHLETADEEQVKDMSIMDFVDAVQKREAVEVFEATEDEKLPENSIKFYPGTRIPVQRIKWNTVNRDDNYFLKRG